MLHSMTGYGKAEISTQTHEVSVEVKSVNSRYLEYTSRLPKAYAYMEKNIKDMITSNISRGKVEVIVSITSSTGEVKVIADTALAQSYFDAMQEIASIAQINYQPEVETLLKVKDIFIVSEDKLDEEKIWLDVEPIVIKAIEQFKDMRKTEGDGLLRDINSRLEMIEKNIKSVEEITENRTEKYTQKLYQKLKVLLEDKAVDEARILTEAAIFADKTAVDEETVRIHSHIEQYREIIAEGGACGRKLDFLTQELNREVNTIGSKCQEIEITRIVVDIKAEIEKIREQIQNLE